MPCDRGRHGLGRLARAAQEARSRRLAADAGVSFWVVVIVVLGDPVLRRKYDRGVNVDSKFAWQGES